MGITESKVLVLNQDYRPLTVCTVSRAFLLIYLGKADMLEYDADQKLRSISRSYALPVVIRIKKYAQVPYHGVVLTRNNLFKRDNCECQYCGSSEDLTLDHLIPRSKGGPTTWKNLVTACKHCNSKKGDLSIEEAGLTLARMPFKPSYVMFLKSNFGRMRKEWGPYLSAVA